MRRSATAATLIAAAFLLLSSCGGGREPDPDPGTGDAPGAQLGGSTPPPILFQTDGMRYQSGYDSSGGTVFTYNQCMQAITDVSADTQADAYANVFDYKMRMVESKAEIYDFLHASYQTEVNYGIGKNQAAFDIANEFKNESESVYVLVRSTWDGPTFYVKNPTLSWTKETFPYANYAEFVKDCGDTFVSGVRAGARFYGMFKFTFSSTSNKNTVRARLSGQQPVVSTTQELENVMQVSTSSSNVEVTARVVGGGPEALDVSTVRTVDGFFDYVKMHQASVKKAIKDGGAAGLATPDPKLNFGYAVSATITPYKLMLQSQYGLPQSWFAGALGETWSNLRPLSTLYAAQLDAYNKLDFMVQHPALFGSTKVAGKSLTEEEITLMKFHRDRFKASASQDDTSRGLQSLMVLCSAPDDAQEINPAPSKFSDKQEGFSNIAARQYCKGTLAKDDPGCDGVGVCAVMFDKLKQTTERQRLPFFTQETISVVDNAIIDANGNVVLSLPAMLTAAPRDCKALKDTSPVDLQDGMHTVYFMGNADQPYSVGCVGFATTTPITYLVLTPPYQTEVLNDSQSPTYNFTTNANSKTVHGYLGWTKYRLESSADGVAIDVLDTSATWQYNLAKTVYGMKKVFWSRSSNDAPLRMNIDLSKTGLAISSDNMIAVQGWGNRDPNRIPRVEFLSYHDEATKPDYIEGVTAFFDGDAATMYLGNRDGTAATRLWLEYVPRVVVANYPKDGDGVKSATKRLLLNQYTDEFWCQYPTTSKCPSANIFVTSFRSLFSQQ